MPVAAAAVAEPRANWVGDWRRCVVCDGLTTGDICSSHCQDVFAERVLANPTPLKPISIAERATVRPSFMFLLSEHEPDEVSDLGNVATWRIPDRASANAKLVAKAIMIILNERLTARWSLTYILRTGALGRDIIARTLERIGQPKDRKTVALCLKELVELGCLDKVGQLPDWVDPSEPTAAKVNKSGAFIYSIAITIRELGRLALEALISNAALGGIAGRDRVQRALKGAVKNAHEGNRNSGGYFLARRCIDGGLTEHEAAKILISYCDKVGQSTPRACPRYTRREAMVTVRSAYRQLARGK
jgi:hypothetical protein